MSNLLHFRNTGYKYHACKCDSDSYQNLSGLLWRDGAILWNCDRSPPLAFTAMYWNIFIPLKHSHFFYIVTSFPLLVFTHSPHTVGSVQHCSNRQTQLVKQKRQISSKFQSTLLGSVRCFSRHNFPLFLVWIPSSNISILMLTWALNRAVFAFQFFKACIINVSNTF